MPNSQRPPNTTRRSCLRRVGRCELSRPDKCVLRRSASDHGVLDNYLIIYDSMVRLSDRPQLVGRGLAAPLPPNPTSLSALYTALFHHKMVAKKQNRNRTLLWASGFGISGLIPIGVILEGVQGVRVPQLCKVGGTVLSLLSATRRHLLS